MMKLSEEHQEELFKALKVLTRSGITLTKKEEEALKKAFYGTNIE